MILGAMLAAAGVYLLIGVVFGVAFALRGAGRIDPVARSGTALFRLLIVPGAAALWPLLATRWARAPRLTPASAGAHA